MGLRLKKWVYQTLVVIGGIVAWLIWAVLFLRYIANFNLGVILYVLVPTATLVWTIFRYRKSKNRLLLTFGVSVQAAAVFIPLFLPALLVLVYGIFNSPK